MKICENCGAYNSDDRMFCVDCNEKLDSKISNAHQKEIDAKIKKTTEKLFNRGDPLYVSVFDKIMGIGCVIASLLLLIFAFILMLKNRGTSDPFIFLIFGVLGAVEAFIPKMNWELEKLRLSLTVSNSDDLSPSSFYRFSRKLSETVCFIICLVGAVITVGAAIHPPVMEYARDMSNTVIDFNVQTVEETVEANPEKWEEIISGGDYTVSKYLEHLKNCNYIGKTESIMIEAIIEIENLDLDYKEYTFAETFLEDYENLTK